MEQLTIVWAKNGILGHPEYAGSFISYRNNLMNSAIDLQNLLDVSDPSSTVWSHAVAECYDRNFNLQIAKLLLPIFRKYPADVYKRQVRSIELHSTLYFPASKSFRISALSWLSPFTSAALNPYLSLIHICSANCTPFSLRSAPTSSSECTAAATRSFPFHPASLRFSA